MLIYKYFVVKDPMVDPRYVFDYEIFIYQHLELLIFHKDFYHILKYDILK